MKLLKLTILLFFMVVSLGCAQLSKTGKFVWKAPGKVVSGVANTGKFMWKITPKTGPQLQEAAKFIWGSSTRSLEIARVDAIEKTYRCSYVDCYDSVLTLTRKEPVYIKSYNTASEVVEDDEGKEDDESDGEELIKIEDDGVFDVFIDNRAKKHIVVMGIKGNVETTEVGIFFSQPSLTTVKLEVSSKSSTAKRKVAEAIFDELDLHFSAAE